MGLLLAQRLFNTDINLKCGIPEKLLKVLVKIVDQIESIREILCSLSIFTGTQWLVCHIGHKVFEGI
jgi:uncharacterized membrane protein YGL010W